MSTCVIVFATISARLADAQLPAHGIVVTGRVLNPAGRPIAHVTVRIGPAEAKTTDSTTTDSTGRFYVPWNGGSPLVLSAKQLGFIPASVYVGDVSAADTLIRDIRLSPIPSSTPSALDAVIVTARHRRPGAQTRTTPGETRNGEFAFILDQEAIAPGDLGQIAAALGPGVLLTGSGDESTAGVSIAGQSPTQNHTSVDGSSYGGSSLPPEAIASAAVVLNEYDVSRGQFTGGELSATTRSGTNVWGGALRASIAPAALKYGNGGQTAYSQPTGSGRLDGGGGGAIIPGQLFVYGAFTASRRSGPAPFLDPKNIGQLRTLGVSPDSAQRFVDAARSFGVVQSVDATPVTTSDIGSALARLDYAIGQRHLLTLRFDGRSAETSNASPSPLALQQGGDHFRSANTGMLGVINSHFEDFQHDLRFYISRFTRLSTPGMAGPAARVLTRSESEDGGLAAFQFGGNMFTRDTRDFLEVADEITAAPNGGANFWRIGALFNEERETSLGGPNAAGTFNFGNVADFETGRPSSFTRGLGARQRATVDYGALYAGDTWIARKRLQFTLGLRMERSWYPGSIPLEPAVVAAFGTEGATVQPELRLLPRFGVKYSNAGGRFIVQGGIGDFRGRLPASALKSALAQRGSEASLTCIGAAAPTPDWSLYMRDPAATPSTCAGGTPIFSSQQPAITLFSRRFGAPRTRRASVDLDWQPINAVFLRLTGTLVRGLSEAVAIDRNLDDRAKFTLADEASRPVFVPVDAIYPGSGGVAPAASRLNPSFGIVRELMSGGRSATEQASAGLDAVTPWNGAVSLWYTFTNSRDQSTGIPTIGGAFPSTGGDPAVREWGSRDFEQRHVLQISLMQRVRHSIALSLIGRLTSGVPFTPLVDGDVNGDGLYNDRAFIFDPATSSDASVASGMTQLLSAAPSSVRDCLKSQLGRVAARSSCHTRWSPWLDLQATIPPWKFGSAQLGLTFTANNVTAGLDYLFHGASGLHGWGQFPFPDNTLLRVRGFDSDARAFRYDVNPAFGSVGTARTPRTPFGLTVQARITFSADPARQAFESLIAAAGSSRRTPEELKVILMKRFPNVPGQTIALARSLHLGLTQDQEASLAHVADTLASPLDLLIGQITTILAGASDPTGELGNLIDSADALTDRGRRAAQLVLLPAQWAKLPSGLRESSRGNPVRPPTRIHIPVP